jgi:hypothetical protein
MGIEHVEGGAYITARAIFDNDLWRHPAQHRIFEYIRGRAIFAKEGYTIAGVHVPRGSFLASYRKIAEGTAWIERNCLKQYGIATVKRVTDELIAKGRLTKSNNDICTIWHVTNYEKYQNFSSYENRGAERWCGTPPTPEIGNEFIGGTDAVEFLRNTGSERVRNNNKNVYECSLLGKAKDFLSEKGIIISSFRLEKRLQTWERIFSEEALSEAFSTAAEAWTAQSLSGDFLRYLNTVLNNDYPKLVPITETKSEQDHEAA